MKTYLRLRCRLYVGGYLGWCVQYKDGRTAWHMRSRDAIASVEELIELVDELS